MASEIEHDGPEALYVQVARILRSEIERGDYPPRKRLPSEAAIAERFDVGRATAREAIRALRTEGVVFTVGQRGTFVAERE